MKTPNATAPFAPRRGSLTRDLVDGAVLLALALSLWSGFALAVSAGGPAPERPAAAARLSA
jgi:hypothetical protein